MVISHCCLNAETLLPNLLPLYSKKNEISKADDDLARLKTICPVCGQRRCPRHRPELNILAFQPWTNLEIRGKVNDAIEEFFNIILKEFVYTWYRDVSCDEEFVDELKVNIRFMTAVLLRRVQKVDIPTIITDKLVKAGLQHLSCYMQAKSQAPSGVDLQEKTLEYLGPRMHCALQSRRAELEYLRRLTECLFPFILRQQALQSKSTCALVREILSGSVLLTAMDAIANPDMVNNMLLIFFDNTPPPSATEPPSPKVSFLEDFSKPLCKNNSCLRVRLQDILDKSSTTSMLYPFMQFLKTEAAINVLQFCLACEDFNNRILNPQLSQGELRDLHDMAKDLYRIYCSPNAVDKIKFDESIVNELREIVEGSPDQVIRLRTSAPLFKAYEVAYNLLENTFLPLFHQSDDYYKMLCGERSPAQIQRLGTNSIPVVKATNNVTQRQTKKKEFGFSNIGTKLKEVFRANANEMKNSIPSDTENTDDADTITLASISSLEDEIPESMIDSTMTEFPLHDLSTWRVYILQIGAIPDPDNNKKPLYVFLIDVRRVDVSSDDTSHEGNWTVPRRYNEFYVLEQKLMEFHGEFPDCSLPPKKTFGTKNHSFIESKREDFEKYLQKLLVKPNLRSSELLYRFLKADRDFTQSFLPDINLGKMFKSVPMKLVKERGQHLDPFLVSFESSTEAPKPRPSKTERRGSDSSQISSTSEKIYQSVYENNANSIDQTPVGSVERGITKYEIDGVFDTFLYIARHVYNIPDWFHHTLVTARILFKNTVETYLHWYISQKIEQVTQEHRLVPIIHLLRDTLFFDKGSPRTDEMKRERFNATLKETLDFLPKAFVSVVGKEEHYLGTRLVLDILQQPKLNKQLSYVFLDIVLEELFPELNENSSPAVL